MKPRHPKSGKFIRKDSLLAKLAGMFKAKPAEGKPTMIAHDPDAKEHNTTRSKQKK